MSTVIPVIKLAFSTDWKSLSSAINVEPQCEIKVFTTGNEAATFLYTQKGALIIASLTRKEDLLQIGNFLKTYKKMSLDAFVKIVVIDFSGDKNLERATAKLGIQDILDPAISTKALRFKIDFWVKGLNAQVKKSEANQAAIAKSLEAQRAAEKKAAELPVPKWVDPLASEDDIWILKNETDCKLVLGKWLVKFSGPSPYVAQWREVVGRNGLWKFEFRNEDRVSFLKSEGNWFFRGEQKPEFIWKDNQWLVMGVQFDLFYQFEKQIHQRVFAKDKFPTICKNSSHALSKEKLILASFEKEIIVTKDGHLTTHQEVSTESGTDKFKNLEGKVKNEVRYGDDFAADLLSMDLEENTVKDGPGKGPAENNNNVLNTYYKGQSEAENLKEQKKGFSGKSSENDKKSGLFSSPASEGVRKGTELDLENKNSQHETFYKGHLESEKFEDQKKGLSGKSSEKDKKSGLSSSPGSEGVRKGSELDLKNKNNQHETFYKGRLDAEKFENQKNGLSGRSSDKEKKSGPLRSPVSVGVRKGTELDLENKNNQHETFYKGHLEAEQYDATERELNGFDAENLDNLSGSTDREEENQNGQVGGKTKTDKLNKFYNKERKESNLKQDNQSEEAERKKRVDRINKFLEKNEKEKSGSEKSQGGEVGGKGSTEKLSKFYNNSQKEEFKTKDDSQSDEAERKKRIERINKYLQKTEKEGSKLKERTQVDHSGGRSQTEKLSKFYKGSIKKESEIDEDADKEADEEALPEKLISAEEIELSELDLELSELDRQKELKKASLEGKSAIQKSVLNRELSQLERQRELKKARKESLEANEKSNQDRHDKRKLDKSLREEEAYESQRKEQKKKAEIKKNLPFNKESDPEKNIEEGFFTEDVKSGLTGKSKTDHLAGQYKNKKKDQSNDEKESIDLDDLDEVLSRPLKENHNRQEDQEDHFFDDIEDSEDDSEEDSEEFGEEEDSEEALSDSGSTKKSVKKSTKKKAPKELFRRGIDKKSDKSLFETHPEHNKVRSIEEARSLKKLERVLKEEEDQEFQDACETAVMHSFLKQENVKVTCKLDDYFDKSIIFSTAEPGIEISSPVALDLRFKYLKEDSQLNFIGTVTKLELDEDGTKYITVEIKPESVLAFDSFLKLYEIRQKNANNFLKRVKGF